MYVIYSASLAFSFYLFFSLRARARVTATNYRRLTGRYLSDPPGAHAMQMVPLSSFLIGENADNGETTISGESPVMTTTATKLSG